MSPDPFSLVEKLSQIFAPLLLPWVTATTMAAATRQSIGVELVVMAILYAAARFPHFFLMCLQTDAHTHTEQAGEWSVVRES